MNRKNKDPCYGLRLLYLRIQHRSFYALQCNQKNSTRMLAEDNAKNNVKINEKSDENYN